LKYYFLSGVPRAGNTILSCLLNQNKNISVTANSYLTEAYSSLEDIKHNNEAYLNSPDEESHKCLMDAILPSYYSKWDSEFIIDRSCWGNQYYMDILKKYCPNKIKIICLVRNIEDVFASFIDWCDKNPKNFINNQTNNGSVYDKFNLLFHPNGQIIKNLSSINNLIKNHQGKYILIDYDYLVENPSEQIDKIYEFLEIPYYEHNFNYIKQSIKYDDNIVGKNLHKIRVNGIKRRNYDVSISKDLINKCKDFNIWK